MNGYWSDDTVCGGPKWHEFPTFTFADAKWQCSQCPIQDGQVWRDDLYVGSSVPHYPSREQVNTTGRCPDSSCQTDCPICFSGPLLD